MDESFKKYRNYFYEYHRLGLDQMADNAFNGRNRIAEGLKILRETNRERPFSAVIASFMDTKADELVKILSTASTKEKSEAIEILSDVSPTQTEKFKTLLKQ